MKWIKLSVDFLQSPKVMAAGPDATLVYLQALALNMRHGRDGVLRGLEAEPRTFSALLGSMGLSVVAAEAAIERAVHVGLLEKDDDGLKIAGWDDDWRPQCSTCHKPNSDPTRATCPGCRERKRKSSGSGIQRKG